jgi:CBS domain-containing protein
MHADVVACPLDTPIRRVAQELEKHHIHALVVVDENGYVVGVISQTDLVRARSTKPDWDTWQDLPASRLMTPYPVMVRPDDSLQLAINLLSENQIHRLVVVNHEPNGQMRPVGILSMTDLVHQMAQDSQLSSEEAG